MVFDSLDKLHTLPRLRRWVFRFTAAGWPLVPVACAGPFGLVNQRVPPPEVRQATYVQPAETGNHMVAQAAYKAAELAPPPKEVPSHLPDNAPAKVLAINLDTVFRLAEENNSQIALAREKLHESQVEQELAAKGWMPSVYAGVGYYRHEGGIQNQDGTLTKSSTGALFPGMEIKSQFDVREATFARVSGQRQYWQTQGELAKVSQETLLEAATTYVDLLTARRGEAIAGKLKDYQLAVLKRAEEILKREESASVLVENIRAEISRRDQSMAQLHLQGDAAAAKLAYLLGLPPETMLQPVDSAPIPIDLVDPTPEPAELVTKALTSGPGIRELESMMGVIQQGLGLFSSPLRFMPVLQMDMVEGGFGAGPNATMQWDNRWDVGLQARYNLTEFLTMKEKRRLAESKLQQVHLTYQDLRGKLAAGVKEARATILSGRDQIAHTTDQIRHASEAYKLSDLRLRETVPGSSTAEVLLSIANLERAHFTYLTSVSAYNKAQIRLMLLLGPCAVHAK